MFVTDLIKHKEYKEFLNANFPFRPPKIIKEANRFNHHPSLTGNAFEIFFLLVHATSKTKNIYKEEIKRAENNILSISRGKLGNHELGRSGGYIKLSAKDFQEKKMVLQKLFKHKHHLTMENLQGIHCMKVSCSILRDIKLIYEVQKGTGLLLWPMAAATTIYDVESLTGYYNSIILAFQKGADKFRDSGKLTKSFVKILLQFTHLCNLYFGMSEPLSHIHFDDDYLKGVQNHFNRFCKKFQPIKGKVIKKPTLSSFKILATPDFIIKDRILEIKTSRTVSKRDYHQAVSYLLFAQFPENKKAYGDITSAIIFYSAFNKEVEIKLADLQITPAILNRTKVQIQSFYKHRIKHYKISQV